MPANPIVVGLARRSEYQGLSDQAAADKANARTITQSDPSRKSYVAIVKLFNDPAKVAALDTGLGQVGLAWVQRSLGGEGLVFSDPLTIAAIDGLVAADKFTPEDAATLKTLGTRSVSPYEDQGGIGTATAEDFAEARAEINRLALLDFVETRSGEVRAAIVAGTAADLAAVKAAMGV